MKTSFISRYILLPVLTITCFVQTSCRSTLTYAASRNDYEVVRRELNNGADIDDRIFFLYELLGLPLVIAAMGIDVTLCIGTLGIYANAVEKPLLYHSFTEFSSTATEVAYYNHHYAMAAYLLNNGGYASSVVKQEMAERGYYEGVDPSALNTKDSVYQPPVNMPPPTPAPAPAKQKAAPRPAIKRPAPASVPTPAIRKVEQPVDNSSLIGADATPGA